MDDLPNLSMRFFAADFNFTGIKRLFITLYLMMMASVSLHAGEPSIEISLGVRDTAYWTSHTNMAYPLAFRFKNTGKTSIKGDDIAGIFEKGIIHLLGEDGNEQHYDLKEDSLSLEYGLVPNDLQPGEISECKLVGDLVTFFPSAKDGDYQVWWTLKDSKSNILCFTAANEKVLADCCPKKLFEFLP